MKADTVVVPVTVQVLVAVLVYPTVVHLAAIVVKALVLTPVITVVVGHVMAVKLKSKVGRHLLDSLPILYS